MLISRRNQGNQEIDMDFQAIVDEFVEFGRPIANKELNYYRQQPSLDKVRFFGLRPPSVKECHR